jgi:putative membrane protein
VIKYDAKSWISVLGRVRGTILPRVLPRVAVGGAVGVVACWLYDQHRFAVPAIGHTLIGAALGLLLVFRTNASYERYWEGRRLVGTIVNRGRDFARLVATLIPGRDPELRSIRRDLVRWMVAFLALGSDQLRDIRDLSRRADLLSARERAELEPVRFRPPVVLAWMSRTVGVALARAGLSDEAVAVRQRSFDETLGLFSDAFGGCERIRSTPVPFAYAHHIKLLVFLFCYTVPFVMVDSMGWITPIATAIVCFGLFGIDEIGVEIEDPFGTDPNDLPMEWMIEHLDVSTREILAAIERSEESAERPREAA